MKSGSLVGDRLGHGTGPEALGANLDPLYFAALQLGAHGLQIGHEAPFVLIVGMTDIVANLGSLPANITYL
jgi:hypothetical protein